MNAPARELSNEAYVVPAPFFCLTVFGISAPHVGVVLLSVVHVVHSIEGSSQGIGTDSPSHRRFCFKRGFSSGLCDAKLLQLRVWRGMTPKSSSRKNRIQQERVINRVAEEDTSAGAFPLHVRMRAGSTILYVGPLSYGVMLLLLISTSVVQLGLSRFISCSHLLCVRCETLFPLRSPKP